MLKGSIVALITPFNDNNSINFEKLAELIEFQISHGSEAVSILGTTGEAPTISFEEKKAIVEFVVKQVAGRVHINVGAGSNNTAQAVEFAQAFEKLGADSLLVITPYYNKTNETGMLKHFTKIAESVNIPIIMYNAPGRTGVNLSVEAVEILAQHQNITGLKEASGDIAYVEKISRYLSNNFALYSGNDDMIVPCLSLGASGVISVWANFMPDVVKELIETFATNPAHSLSLQQKYLNLVDSLFIEANPIPVKFVMNQLGYNVGSVRLPLDEPSERAKIQLLKELEIL